MKLEVKSVKLLSRPALKNHEEFYCITVNSRYFLDVSRILLLSISHLANDKTRDMDIYISHSYALTTTYLDDMNTQNMCFSRTCEFSLPWLLMRVLI